MTWKEYRESFDRAFLTSALESHDWNISHTAKAINVTRASLHNWINRLELKR